MALAMALMALVTLVNSAAGSLMNINEVDLITDWIDIYSWDSYRSHE